MTHLTIRRIDRHIGGMVCGALTILRKALDLASSGASGLPRKIVFLKLVEQGATVQAIDAIEFAIGRIGRDNVYLCVFPENRAIVDALALIPPANILNIRSGHFGVFLLDSLRATLTLRRARVDSVVDFEFFSRATAVLAFLCGARRRAGLHRFNADAPYRGDLFTHRVAHNPYLHVAQAYRLLVEVLWQPPNREPRCEAVVNPPRPTPQRPVPDDDLKRVNALLVEVNRGPLPGPLVVIGTSAGDMLPLRRWPLERFRQLGQYLLAADSSLTLAFVGTAAETAAVQGLCSVLGRRALDLTGRTTLLELLALNDVAQVLVSTDSGTAQFAALSRIHNIVLFGPETPAVFGPVSLNTQALSARLPCSPCYTVYNHRTSTCTHNACLHAISAEEVRDRVLNCLETERSRQVKAGPPAS